MIAIYNINFCNQVKEMTKLKGFVRWKLLKYSFNTTTLKEYNFC